MKLSDLVLEARPQSNKAGAPTVTVSDETALDRFLILNSLEPTYYADQSNQLSEFKTLLDRCLKNDAAKTIQTIIDTSISNRPIKRDPGILALAYCWNHGDLRTRQTIEDNFGRVIRTGTDLFTFCENLEASWGSSAQRMVSDWYNKKQDKALVYQLIKYRNRNGWRHEDVFSLSHPKPQNDFREQLYRWVVGKGPLPFIFGDATSFEAMAQLEAFNTAQKTTREEELIHAIGTGRLTWEMIPTEMMTPKVWEVLIPDMGLTAMIRSLVKLTTNGVLTPTSKSTSLVLEKLANKEALKNARIHPVALLLALGQYRQGYNDRRASWTPITSICNALEAAFYNAFAYLPTSGKKIWVCLDVSGSMTYPCYGSLNCREVSVAIALAIKASEPQAEIYTFSDSTKATQPLTWEECRIPKLTALELPDNPTLGQAVEATSRLRFGGTNCAIPMLHALERKEKVDAFLIVTDMEHWAGNITPMEALAAYTDFHPQTIAVAAALTATTYSIFGGEYNTLNVVGTDPQIPALITNFVGG